MTVEQLHKADLLARNGLGYFTERVFGTLNPGTTYEHNWHIDCLPYGEKVVTPDGEREIGWVVESGYCGKVLSFSHSRERLEWRKVTNRMKNVAKPLYILVSSQGDRLSLSAEHPVWVAGGYIKASEVTFGDKIMCLVQPRISGREEESLLLSEMFRGEESCIDEQDLFLRETKGLPSCFLQTMFWCTLQKWKKLSLCLLRQVRLLPSCEICRGSKEAGDILQPRLFRLFHERREKPCVHRWSQAESDLSPPTTQNSSPGSIKARGWKMFPLSIIAKAFGYAPYRPGYFQQFGNKHRYVMPTLPQQTKRSWHKCRIGNFKVSEFVVDRIEHSIQLSGSLYNIEVEANNNFFANGILTHNCIAEHLRAVESGEIKRLIVNIPPRAMKSISISIAFPAWLLGHNPSEQIVVASYSKELSLDMSVKCRDVIRSDWYKRCFPATELKSDQDEKGKFATTRGGQRFATSVGGTVTGMGGEYLIIDDPVNPEQAASDVERKSANNWVRSTFMSRFNDDRTGRAILVMQRLHADDVTGMFLELGGWTHLMLPAQFSKREIIAVRGKTWEVEAGEYMDKARRTEEVLLAKMRDLGPLDYAAQFLQNPTPDEGAFFKKDWLRFYDKLPDDCRFYGASDFAVSSEGGDYTVHMVFGISPEDDWYVADVWREQVSSDIWANALVDMIEDWKPLEWLEEKGVIEKAVDPLVTKIMMERRVNCYRRKVASINDKVTRAQPLRGRMAAGRVHFPKDKPWVAALMKEVMEFPNSKHDDQVDSMSLFGRMVHNLRAGVVKAKPVVTPYVPKPILMMDLLNRHKARAKRLRTE